MKRTISLLALSLAIGGGNAWAALPVERASAAMALKVPGNPAVDYPLTVQASRTLYRLEASEPIPVTIVQKATPQENGNLKVEVAITALDDVYFNYRQLYSTGYSHPDCLFYLPGFWYRHNLRSPKEAPSFHTSDSWVVREDRLSAPLTGIYDPAKKAGITVGRLDAFACDALTTHKQGEVILSGKTSIGFTGFENSKGVAALSFGKSSVEKMKSFCLRTKLIIKRFKNSNVT